MSGLKMRGQHQHLPGVVRRGVHGEDNFDVDLIQPHGRCRRVFTHKLRFQARVM